MGVVEDVRKLLQDLVTPELRALSARMDALEKSVADLRSEMRELRSEMRDRFEDLKTSFRLDERLSFVESELRSSKKNKPQ